MKKLFAVIPVFFSFTYISAQAPANEIPAKLAEYFSALKNIEKFNGNVLIAKNGRILLDSTFNIQTEIPGIGVNKETKFIIASVSKLYIKFGILKLAEQHRLKLEDKLSRFIPDFPNGDKITVDQLMHHRSGLPRELKDYESYDNLSLEKAVQLAHLEKLEFTPGTQTLYSNIGFFLLHYIISKAAKEGYPGFIQKEVLQKMRLNNTNEFTASSRIKNFASGFDFTDGSITAAPAKSTDRFETGNYFSTINDMYSFSRQMTSGKIIKKSAALKMFSKEGILEQGGARPGYRAYFYKNLKTGITFIFLCNYSNIPIQQVTQDVANILGNKPYKVPKAINRTGISLSRDILDRYTGKFVLEADIKQAFTITVEKGKLIMADGTGETTELKAENETVFFDDPHSDDGYIFSLNPSTGKYDLTIITTGFRLKTKRTE